MIGPPPPPTAVCIYFLLVDLPRALQQFGSAPEIPVRTPPPPSECTKPSLLNHGSASAYTYPSYCQAYNGLTFWSRLSENYIYIIQNSSTLKNGVRIHILLPPPTHPPLFRGKISPLTVPPCSSLNKCVFLIYCRQAIVKCCGRCASVSYVWEA